MEDAGLAPARQSPSHLRQAGGPIRTFGLDLGPATFAPPQPEGWAHLVTLRSGAATLRSRSIAVLVTPRVAVWVPAGERYALELHGRVALRAAYLADGFGVVRRLGPVALTPLLAELIERAVVGGYLDPSSPRDARLIAVIADEIRALQPAADAYALALPSTRELRAIVERALAASEEPPSVAALAAAAGMSQRTFERAFFRETGMSPRAWFRYARLGAAAAALASGASVTEAGLIAGYASLSAFIAAFVRAFGTTPGRLATSRAVTSPWGRAASYRA
jgi:AraC-like DNA-binding protein